MLRTLTALALLATSGTALAASPERDGVSGLRDDTDQLASNGRPASRARPAPTRPSAAPTRPSAPASRSSAARPAEPRGAARGPAPARSRPAAPPVRRPAPAPAHRRPLAHTHPRPPAYAYPHRHVHPHPHVYGRRYVYVPHRHTHVHVAHAPPPRQVVHRPPPGVDREGTLALGLRMGSLVSGYSDSPYLYSDPGLGLAARYRPSEGVGLEVAVQHHDESWSPGTERSQTLLSGSLELFAWPSSRVSPYVLGGLTYNARDLSDVVLTAAGPTVVTTSAPLAGPHLGAGLEIALGDSLALDFEARYISYWAGLSDGADRGALTTTAGLMVHF